MEITLATDLEDYVKRRVREGVFGSPSEVIAEALRRKREEDEELEQLVIEADRTELSPLTQEDLQSVRDLIQGKHASAAA
jgi:putative addiction module CopG family antidote